MTHGAAGPQPKKDGVSGRPIAAILTSFRRAERSAVSGQLELLLASELHRWLKEKYEQLRLTDAAKFERETKVASGRLTIAVPRSLHAALKSEAAAEGVSLSELMRLKLSMPYRQMANMLVPRTKAN